MKKILFYLLLILLIIGTQTSLIAQTFPGTTGAITDNNCAGGNFNIFTASVSGIGTNLGTDVFLENVTLDITHTWAGDLQIFIQGPNGNILELSTTNDDNAGAANYTNTVFTDAAAGFITAGTAPFTGEFRPEGRANALACNPAGNVGDFTFASQFNGSNPNGTWQLYVADNAASDTGVLNSWSISFASCLAPTATLDAVAIEPCTSPGQFEITVDLTDLGSASSVDILNNGGATAVTGITAPDMFTIGPFNNGDLIEVTVVHNDNSDCNILGFVSVDDCPPTNDECSGAITFSESTDAACADAVSGTTLGATVSTDNQNCGGAEEVWFQYTATSANVIFQVSNLAATSAGGTPERAVVAIYTGNCGALALVAGGCSFAPACVAVSPGTTYFVSVETRSADNVTTPATFDLCVYPCPTLPNDECADATDVPESPSAACANSVFGTTINATASVENSTDCGGATPDIWFKHVASTTGRLELTASNFMGDLGSLAPERAVVGIYSGTSCGALTFISCTGLSDGVPTSFNATAGTTYYIAIDTRNEDFTFLRPGSFDLCIYPCPLPANDECNAPMPVSESDDGNCNNVVQGNTLCATNSTDNDCGFGNEVWFSYVGDGTDVTIDAYNLMATAAGGEPSAGLLTVYTGTCGGGLSQVVCGFSPLSFPAMNGVTYLVSVETRNAENTSTPATFDFCIYPCGGGAPANDLCTSPGLLTESTDNSCNNPVNGTTVCATPTEDNIASAGGEVWYVFTADTDASLHVFESVNTSDGSPSTVAVYSGACGLLSLLGSGTSPVSVTLTQGMTYLVMVTTQDANGFAIADDFTLCAYPSIPPVNDDCLTATALDLANIPITLMDVDANTATIDEAGQPTCVNNVTSGTDIFYSFVGDGSMINIEVTEKSGGDVELSLYSGDCNALSCEVFMDDPESILDFTTVDGTNYVLKIAGFSSATNLGTIDIMITSAALAVELTDFSGYTTGKTNVLAWTTANEINAKNYIVERSFNGRTAWTKVGSVAATGNSTSALDYSLIDANPSAIAYYRLVSVDINGTTQTSDVILLERKGEVGVQVYPVPAQEQVSIDFNGNDNETVTIFINDVAGRLIHQVKLTTVSGLNTTNIDISQFANGIYFLTLDNNGTKATNRMIKQ